MFLRQNLQLINYRDFAFAKVFELWIKIFRNFVTLLTIVSFLFSQIITSAYAANQTDIPYLVPDGSTNTTTDRAPNGTPIVNIAAPNQAGVSLNNWRPYNVTSENQILNNAKGLTVNTELAGQIYGNPNLNPDGVNPASIIINQDLGHQRSSIDGAVEVAGRSAELVFANGNGFDIKGSAFINTSRVTIVTGQPNLNPQTGALENFNISNQAGSNVIISGVNVPGYLNLGINGGDAELNIISRAVQVMADIHTRGDLNIKLGNGAYDYKTGNITSDVSLGVTTKPAFSLDSSYVGGMYAGRIRIIATEDGVGVRSRGDLVSSANIDLSSVGGVEFERADAKTNLYIISSGNTITFGKYADSDRPAITRALGDITLSGKNGIDLNDSSQASNFYAAGSIYLNSASGLIKNNSTIKADSTSQANGGLFIDSASFENTSLAFSAGKLSIITSGLSKNTSGSIEAVKSINVDSGTFSNSSLVKSGSDITLISAGSFSDQGQIKAVADVLINANSGISFNDIYSGGNLSITNSGSGDINQTFRLYSLGTTSITNNGGNIILGQVGNTNLASLYSEKAITLKSSEDLTSNVDIFGNQGIGIESKNFTNNQKITANSSNLTIISSAAVNNNGAVSVKNFSLTAGGFFKNTANLQSSQNLILNQAASIDNSSIIQSAGDIALNSLGGFSDYGQIKASGDLSIMANSGISYNYLYSGGNLSLANNLSGDINHNHKSYSLGSTTIINNGGNIIFGLEDNSNSGSLFSKANLTLYSSLNIVNNSDIFSEKKINLTAQGLTNNMRIMAVGSGTGSNSSDLTINLDQNLSNKGLLFANQNINLNVDGTVTNDGNYNAEIFALNGNININGKLYSASYGNVSKYDFFVISFDKSAEIWADLLAKGYIDSNGKVTEAFKDLSSSSGMNISSSLAAYKDAIYNILSSLSTKLVLEDSVCEISGSCKFTENHDGSSTVSNSLDRISKDFDNRASEIFTTLRNSGYIDSNGKVTQQFFTDTKNGGANALIFKDANGDVLANSEISYLKNDIYQLLEDARTGRVIENTFLGISGLNSSQISSGENQGANLSSVLITELKKKGYIDADGNITSAFNALGNADALASNLSSDFAPYKQAIFDQIVEAKTINKASESNFSSITYQPINNIGNLTSLFSQLQAEGYIDSNGNILNSNVTSDTFLDSYKTSVSSILNSKYSFGQAAESDFSSITFSSENSIDSASSLVAQLTNDGYLDAFGNIQNKFYAEGISSLGIYADYKNSLDVIFSSKASKGSVQQSDFSSVSYQPINNINNAAALLNQLKTEGFIDSNGNITEKFYTDGIASSSSSLVNYQSSINSVLSQITQATLDDSAFRKISKSLDNSASRLVGDLIEAGYLDANGKKTESFNFADENAFAIAFTSVADGGEYETVRSAIWNKLNAEDENYRFKDSDFIGAEFDSDILYNENQILMTSLINSGYISSDGDVKQSFFSLSGDYNNLNLDSRFSGLKGQIGALLASIAPSQQTITTNNLVSAASGNTKDKAGQIFDKLIAKGYLNSKGDFTQKLMDEVINYSGDDAQKVAQLQVVLSANDLNNSSLNQNFSDYASGIFQELKSKNGATSIKNFATKVENISGGKISSSFGDINIKAITFHNLAKDNNDVVSNPENGINRTSYRGINRAWQNTVLWGYDAVSSTLDSNSSFLKAGKNLSINADKVWNNSSVVTAGNDIDLRVGNLDSTRTQFTISSPYIYETHWKKCRRFRGCKSGNYFDTSSKTDVLRSNTASVISSGNNLNISALSDVSFDVPKVDSALKNSKPNQTGSNPNSPTSSGVSIVLDPTKPNSSAWQINIPIGNNGLFKKANPDSRYLIESSYGANDPNRLTGSAYFKSRFGFDPNENNIKWLGDPFYEWNAINEQILITTKKQRDWSEWEKSGKICASGGVNSCDSVAAANQNSSSINLSANPLPKSPDFGQYLNDLIDNAYEQQADLKLAPGVKLTLAQVNALKKDIIWYEEEIIKLADGSLQKVVVPKVYLTKDSFFNSEFGSNSVVAGKNININAGKNISSNGTVLSSLEKTNLEVAGNVSVKNDYFLIQNSTDLSTKVSAFGIKDDAESARSSATFNSGTDLQIISGGSIDIANNYFQTGGSIFMSAVGDISNSNFTIKADDNVLMDAVNINNIHTLTGNGGAETRIEAGNMASLNASGNITNIGATIRGGNLLYMTAGNDITNKALVDYKINGRSATEDEALSSNARSVTSSLIAQGSLESGGNLVIVAGNDINNIGSKITSTGSTLLEATDGDVNIATSVLRDREVTSGGRKKFSWSKTTDKTTNIASEITSGGDLYITAASSSSTDAGDINIKGSKLTSTNNTEITAENDVNITAAQDTSYSQFSSRRKGNSTFGSNSRSSSSTSSSITQIASEITTTNNGDINVTSGVNNSDVIGSDNAKGSISIIASKLITKDEDNNSLNNSGSGDINLTAKNNLNIASALNSSYTESSSNKKGASSLSNSKNIAVNQTNVSSNLIANNDINVISGADTTITASNLSGTNGAIFVGKYTDPTDSTNISFNPNAELIIQSGQDYSYKYSETMKIKTDGTAVAVGIIAAVAVTVATGGAGAVAIASAAAGGATTGMQGKKGKTSIEETTQITQVSSNLNFTNDINIQSASDTIITASKLSADSATILTGKFRDNLGAETVVNSDAKLSINSAFDTYKHSLTVERVKPNYAGIAVVAGASAYVGSKAVGKIPTDYQVYAKAAGIIYTGYSASENIDPESRSFMDPVLNIRESSYDSISRNTEVKSELNFENLINE